MCLSFTLFFACAICLAASTRVEYMSVAEGDRVELLCGNGGISELWDRNGTSIVFGQHCSCSVEGNQLVIHPVSRHDTGRYVCTLGEVIYSLFVVAPPTADIQGDDVQRVSSSSRLELSYSLLEGSNITSVSWSKGGAVLSPGSRTTQSGNTLTVESLTSSDAGVYMVNVTNIAGSAQATVTVVISFPPEVNPMTDSPIYLVTPQQPITLTCSMLANPPITTVSWTRQQLGNTNTETVSNFNRSDVPVSHEQTRTISSVLVLSTGEDDQFLYVCTGTNSLGQTSEQYTIREGAAPPQPTGVIVANIQSEEAEVQWTALDGSLVESLRLRWWIVGGPPNLVQVDKNRTTYHLQDLVPGTEYIVAITSVNIVGTSQSEEVPFTTLYKAPTLAPVDLKLEWKQSSEAVQLSWKAAIEPPQSAVEEYVVKVDGLEYQRMSGVSLNVTGLVRGRQYTFTVEAYNSGGSGPPASLPYTVPVVRSPPVIKYARRISQQSFEISWTRPLDSLELQQYNLTIMDGSTEWLKVIDGDKDSVCYTGPDKNANYRVFLISWYKDGSYASSENLPVVDVGGQSSQSSSSCLPLVEGVVSDPPEGLSPGAIAAMAVVGGVLLIAALVCAVVVTVVCFKWRMKTVEFESNSSTSHSRIVTNTRPLSPPLDSPLTKSSFIYNKHTDSARLQYYDINNMYRSPDKLDDIDVQIVGVEV